MSTQSLGPAIRAAKSWSPVFENLVLLIAFGAILGTVILVHELGHFVAARAVQVRIKELGIGLPPRLTRLGSFWGAEISLNWIPLGGFVRPAGEFDSTISDGLAASPKLARIGILIAGSLANLVLSILLMTAAYMVGWPDQVEVLSVEAGSPAATAGLMPGDRIIEADHHRIRETGELRVLLEASAGAPVSLEVDRGAQIVQTTIWPPDPSARTQAGGLAHRLGWPLGWDPWPRSGSHASRHMPRQLISKLIVQKSYWRDFVATIARTTAKPQVGRRVWKLRPPWRWRCWQHVTPPGRTTTECASHRHPNAHSSRIVRPPGDHGAGIATRGGNNKLSRRDTRLSHQDTPSMPTHASLYPRWDVRRYSRSGGDRPREPFEPGSRQPEAATTEFEEIYVVVHRQ